VLPEGILDEYKQWSQEEKKLMQKFLKDLEKDE
jgi:hypothetical protein